MSKHDIAALQRSLRHFSRKYKLHFCDDLVDDGELGPKTRHAVVVAKYFLGYGKRQRHDGKVKGPFVRRLRHPHSPHYFAPKMYTVSFARRRARRKKLARSGRGPAGAIRWAAAQYAKRIKEQPPGSNRGPGITDWQRALASYLIGLAWCGTFVGTALRRAGVRGIDARVAGVAAIEDMAKAPGTVGGFQSWHGSSEGIPGDAAVLFGRGVHVELIAKRISGGYLTYGGNTSYEGGSGSQSNGGCVARRFRSYSVVRGCARPAY